MRFKLTARDGFSVVERGGDVDLSCSAAAREIILKSLATGLPTLVDLSAVTYIDSSGVASLVEGYQMARRKQLEFSLLNVSEAVLSVLQLAHLDKVFKIHAAPGESPAPA